MITFGDRIFTHDEVMIAAAIAIGLLLIVLIWSGMARRSRLRAAEMRAATAERQMHGLRESQAELSGQLQAFANLVETRQGDMLRSVSERLDGMSQNMGANMAQNSRTTHENLTRLQARLAVIDQAQSNMRSLSEKVVELQSILADKQTRGAFGEGRMEAIIRDALPHGTFRFQAALSTGSRPDCLIDMPGETPPLVVDAKFPLEGWQAMRDAERNDEDVAPLMKRFTRDMDIHIKAISDKYLIKGETQDTAFLFVPSESIFADLHAKFEPVVQRAARARVMIVSPALLMLSVQLVQSLLKDARMRDEAYRIQAEVTHLLDDVRRLEERVGKLQTHLSQSGRDVEEIMISARKITRRGGRIEELDFADQAQAAE